jgi:epoxyqueuosine reductase QueG
MLSSLTIKQRALDLGFDLAGIAPIGVWKDLEFSQRWVEKGFNGEMRYLENPKRFDPRLVLPSVKSVICVGLVYNAGFGIQESGSRTQTRSQKAGGRSRETEERVSGVRCRVSGGEWVVEREAKEDSRGLPPKIAPAPSLQPLAPFLFNGQRTTDNVQGRRGDAPRRPYRGSNGPRTTGDRRFPSSSDEFRISSFHVPASASAAPRAWISRYAWGLDYHEIMRAKLEKLRTALEELAPNVETRVFVDTGPVVERAFARFSGIGWMGKNTCIINQEKGSWFFLGVILTSLELAPDLPAPDRCGSCTACLEACPTEALVEPYVMDASRCISYLTIEIKRAIPEPFRPKIGANIFGCDICQDVCPWNSSRQSSVVSHQLSAFSYEQRRSLQKQSSDERCVKQAAITKVPQFHPMTVATIYSTMKEGSAGKQPSTGKGQLSTNHGQRATETASFSLFNPPLDALASLSEKDFRRIFAHSPIKRAKYRGWLRNLCVAMGNSGDERFVLWLKRAAHHSDPLVCEHAAWALARLRK